MVELHSLSIRQVLVVERFLECPVRRKGEHDEMA